MPSTYPPYAERMVSTSDGLKVYVRIYGEQNHLRPPVVCLPGLSRNANDFHALALALVAQKRRVLALDYRGRGRSDYDPDWRRYDLGVEQADIHAVLAATRVETAVFLGTSRGGLHAMLLAATHPTLVKGVILNDVGPVLEPAGLRRIRATLGKEAPPRTLAEAVDGLKRAMSAQFTALTESDWETYARATYEDQNGDFGLRFDPMLTKPLETLDLDAPLPSLWPQFEALRATPLLAIRGDNSDLLSPATFAEMGRRHPACEGFVVAGQGHAPLLLDAPSIEHICAFVARLDAA